MIKYMWNNFFYLIQEKKEANIKKLFLANPERGYESLSSDCLSGLILTEGWDCGVRNFHVCKLL